jgi:hypothetical protein
MGYIVWGRIGALGMAGGFPNIMSLQVAVGYIRDIRIFPLYINGLAIISQKISGEYFYEGCWKVSLYVVCR